MTREEAIAKGVEVEETKHSMKRRTPWHDYSLAGTYLLTLVVLAYPKPQLFDEAIWGFWNNSA